MTVSMQVSKRIYAGNGVTRQWEVDFPLASPQDVRVYVTSAAGAETELEADFELNAAGTELIYPTDASGKPPLAEGWSLTLERQTPLTQEIDLIRQGEVDAEVLESGYDKLTLMVQELNEKVSRSIKYPVSTSVEDLETDSFLRNILSVKQDAIDASSSAADAAQLAQISAANAQQTAQGALADIEASKVSAQDEIAASGMLVENSLQTYVAAAQEEAAAARYYAQRSIGKTVGEVYFSQSSSEADNPGALSLFTGETIANFDEIYPDFYAWLAEHAELTCTMDEYEAALTQFGECAQYGVADSSVRLPLLKNYVKAASAEDGVKNIEAGLPNVTAKTYLIETVADRIASCATAPFYEGPSRVGVTGGTYTTGRGQDFDLSKANDIYGKSATVTPASTTLYPWVVAFNAAVEASVAQAGAFQQALSGKADINLGNVADNIDYVVETYRDDAGNWFRLYKSGWCEQGGISVPGNTNSNGVSFLKPLSGEYTLLASRDAGSEGVYRPQYIYSITGNRTSTGFSYSVEKTANRLHWTAYGQAAN